MGTILILPVLPYLACFLPLLRKSMQREEYLEMGLFLNGPVNLIGFLLTFWGLQPFGLEIDLYNTAWHDAAYGLHLALLLFAVVASSVMSMLLRAFLRRSRKLRSGSCVDALEATEQNTHKMPGEEEELAD